MIVNPRNLSVLSYANGFTLWHLNAAADGLSRDEVYKVGSVLSLSGHIAPGDMVLITAADGGTLAFVTPDIELRPLLS